MDDAPGFEHAGYFCARHGFVLIDWCICPDGDLAALWVREADDERYVQVLERYRTSGESSVGGAGGVYVRQEAPAERGAGVATPGAPTMCSSGDHGDVPAVGDALTDETEEEPNDERYPYCGECLDTLGADYEARRWDETSEGGAGHG